MALEFSALFYKNPTLPPATVSLSLVNLIARGQEGEKGIVDVQVNKGNKSRRLRMFAKLLNGECQNFSEAHPSEVLEKHHRLRCLGLPVVPTIRYDPSCVCYLMTDVTEGGTYDVVDSNNPLRMHSGRIKNIRDLMQETVQVAETAYYYGNGVFLDSDAYAVLVNRQTGVGFLSLLDIFTNSYLLSGGETQHRSGILTLRCAKDNAIAFNDINLKRRVV